MRYRSCVFNTYKKKQLILLTTNFSFMRVPTTVYIEALKI